MAGFDVVRRSRLSPAEAWDRVTDWQRHEEFVPLTRIKVDVDAASGRESFVARTGIGRLGFDDAMLVTYSRPPTSTDPGFARIVKQGRAVLGWAVLTVTPTETGCEVRWHEEARMRGTWGPIEALVNQAVKGGFSRLLDGLLGDAPEDQRSKGQASLD